MGTNLKIERKNQSLTQLNVSQALGVTKATYANIETGARKPSLKTALKLQDFFNKPIEYLLAESEDATIN